MNDRNGGPPRRLYGDPVPRKHGRPVPLAGDEIGYVDPVIEARVKASRLYHDAKHERDHVRNSLVHLTIGFATGGVRDAQEAHELARQSFALAQRAAEELVHLPPKPDDD